MNIAYLPSPSQGVWHVGPVPIRAYALCIILGIVAAIWIGERRFRARGGPPGTVADVAIWAVPFGIVGGRLYHVLTSPEPYFGSAGDPISALYIWRGGLGIWGAIALGGVGAWIACRRRGIPLPVFADALAPGIAVAQAIGRWGNWFNQELYGRPTTLPWAIEIDPAHRPTDSPEVATYHPTFLYESLWDLGVAALVVVADRRFRLGHGRAFALYVAAYTVGRGWIEYLRIDTAHEFFGIRLNILVSAVVLVGAVVYFVASALTRPGREAPEVAAGRRAAAAGAHVPAPVGAAHAEGAGETDQESAPLAVDREAGGRPQGPASSEDEPK